MNIDELIKAIKEINPDAKTSGLKKAELEALLAQLQNFAINPSESKETAEEPAKNVPRETDPEILIENNIAEAELEPAFYVVSEGRAITSKRGILPAGDVVEARDFVGGEDTLKSLLERGLIE